MAMDLKDWFSNRRKRRERENLVPKQPLSNEEYCALWKQCFQCREMLYARDLRHNLHVCPKCQYHFRIGAEERIEQIADPDTFVEIGPGNVLTGLVKKIDESVRVFNINDSDSLKATLNELSAARV